MSLNPGLVSG